MRTKKEILEDKYTIDSNGKEIVFSNKTPLRTAKKIVELYNNKTRIVIDYGDVKTGKSWNEIYDITGTIGVCKGYYDLRYPILIHNIRSMGGGIILTDCILTIKESKGKKLLFKHKS